MNSQTVENYLKAMFNLSEKNGEVSVNDLSKALQIKMPTVNNMVKKLAAKGLVNYQIYKPVSLTKEGKNAALNIIRKHRLTEMFLVEKMGFGWEEVHEVAEQIEHIHSPKFFAKMDELLDFPSVDPHGSPIPDSNGNIPPVNYQKLNRFQKGDRLKIVAVTNSDEAFLKFLNSKEIHLNLVVEIVEKEEFDDVMTIRFSNQQLSLSSKVTEKLLVEKVQ